jgi:RNA polymerase sigma-70 factor (ECF subfamily)
MRQLRSRDDKITGTPAEQALALAMVTEMDLLRLKSIARLHARGLPADVGWEDLLQEAFARVLAGTRRRPEGLPVVVFLAGVMRSLRAEYLRHRQPGGERHDSVGSEEPFDPSAEAVDRRMELRDTAADPALAVGALQEIAAIERLFAGDAVALCIIEGLGQGLTAEQIRAGAGILPVDYDSARKRIRRVLLREGLTCERR